MKILYKVPGEPLRSMVIPNELGVMQQLVDGYIEPIYMTADLVLICNDEGRINGIQKNFYLDAINDFIFGPVLFVGSIGEDFTSISAEDEKRVRQAFDKEVPNG